MSSRALRKLQGQAHQELTEVINSSEPEEEDSQIKNTTTKKKNKIKSPVNPFALLEDEDDVNKDEGEEEIVEEEIVNNDMESQPTDRGSNKRKKKKKKKKHKEVPKENKDEDEIDASVREVNRLLQQTGVNGEVHHSPDFSTVYDMKPLLTVEHKHLNPDNEMRRIFGSRVVQAETSGRQRQRGRIRQRISWLTTPKENWPPMEKTGLSMSLLENKNGCQYFTFEHNTNYQQIQFKFYDAVESLDPQNIGNIIQLHPYHIDALIQLSEVFRMGEDMQAAAELIERALFACELSFHPLFSLTTGTCRLDFKRSENRNFFLALFKHLAIIGQKGCYRTALEFCKLLLNLDPEDDPMCVLLMIDFYALRAGEYTFLIRLFQEWEAHRNLSQLPNFAFSVPLAMYYDAQQSDGDTNAADTMLQDALLMFPGVLSELLDKCSVSPDPVVSSHSFFGPASQYSQSSALKQLVGLYVGRCHSCWKPPEVMLWLEQNVKAVLERVDNRDEAVDDCLQKRKMRYQGTPRNILRHILISEIKDATAALPPDLANTTVMSYDPLPPVDSVSSYNRPERRRHVQDGGALSMFFRSLLPNFNIDEPVGEGAVGGQEGNNLRQGVGALMDAMRDLLNNIRPIDPPVENQNGEEEEEDPDEWD